MDRSSSTSPPSAPTIAGSTVGSIGGESNVPGADYTGSSGGGVGGAGSSSVFQESIGGPGPGPGPGATDLNQSIVETDNLLHLFRQSLVSITPLPLPPPPLSQSTNSTSINSMSISTTMPSRPGTASGPGGLTIAMPPMPPPTYSSFAPLLSPMMTSVSGMSVGGTGEEDVANILEKYSDKLMEMVSDKMAANLAKAKLKEEGK